MVSASDTNSAAAIAAAARSSACMAPANTRARWQAGLPHADALPNTSSGLTREPIPRANCFPLTSGASSNRTATSALFVLVTDGAFVQFPEVRNDTPDPSRIHRKLAATPLWYRDVHQRPATRGRGIPPRHRNFDRG